MLEIIIIHNMNNTGFVFVFVHNRILPGRALILADMRTKLKPPVSVSFIAGNSKYLYRFTKINTELLLSSRETHYFVDIFFHTKHRIFFLKLINI